MTHFCIGLFLLHLLLPLTEAFAYEIPTHQELSGQAVDRSVLTTDSAVLANLGLKGPIDNSQKFPNYLDDKRTIRQLIQDDSGFEDNDIRVQSHFYDPVNNRPLADGVRFFPHTSPDWALEDRGEVTGLFPQNNSFLDGRRFFLTALTAQSPTER